MTGQTDPDDDFEERWLCGCGAISASVGCCETCGATRGLIRVTESDVEGIPTIEGAPFMVPGGAR